MGIWLLSSNSTAFAHGTVPPWPTAQNAAPAAATTAPAAILPAPAVKPQALKVSYRYRKGYLTKLSVSGIPAGEKLKVTVKCPRKKGCPKSPTTVRKLVGKRLAKGTKLTFTAGKAAKTIRL